MRDPFPMDKAKHDPRALWIVDTERLTLQQFNALASIIAAHYGVDGDDCIDDVLTHAGFGIDSRWIEQMEVGAEGYQRTLELKEFLETHPNPSTESAKLAYRDFHADQVNRWINGNEIPPPLPSAIDEVDPQLLTPELLRAIERNRISQMLSGYSVLDVLSGRAMVDILNAQETDPDVSWSLVGDEDEDEEF